MRIRTIVAVLAASLLGGSALAADLPPYAGSHDDASYGEATHATLSTQGEAGQGAVAAGAAYDDTRYPGSTAPARRAEREQPRMACSCTR